MEKQQKIKVIDRSERKEEIDLKMAERKEDLDRIRGMRKVIDPERRPENKR
ncbi:hypothetical protein [Biomaibacter acetigenes]|jgi:dsDNA-binding SOS-regulon protein|uniref:hypothetical protein n=1 Tax=Biomaibacter acetigenes TaxID=2316383 RepID=UPI0013CF107A|nr:hypothetical protein [Biomaibacter acetigenes]